MATGGKGREEREARERARVYAARQELHARQDKRRRRDNLLAGIVGGAVILAAVGAQTLYFTAGPGAPKPTPSATTPAPAGSMDPGTTPEPTAPAPDPVETEPAVP